MSGNRLRCLLGSEAYLAQLPAAQREKIALYLNFDMIASPNGAQFVLDLGLPDLDGAEALKMLRSITDVPVIIATARDDEAEIVR
ncbi:M28 family peptidase, partial [Streptomyces sp. JV181]|uniref:M28 family peptidase n=1 Tax=Streptomyces sp. JV181 TaxID=858635 RepID=UPI002E78B161